jgi:hypothetical protein
MFESPLHEALEVAMTIASLSFAAVWKGVHTVAGLTGIDPILIVACGAGLLCFFFAFQLVLAIK